MIEWIVAVTSLVAYAAVARFWAPRFAEMYAANDEEQFPTIVSIDRERYRREAAWWGFVGGVFWPIALLVILVSRIYHSGPAGLDRVRFPSEVKAEAEQHKQEVASMRQRIAELEQELEIGDGS